MAHKLGGRQAIVFDLLKARSGYWYDGCGWSYGSFSTTLVIMESLHKRELVRKVKFGELDCYVRPGFNAPTPTKRKIQAHERAIEPPPAIPEYKPKLPFSAEMEALECLNQLSEARTNKAVRLAIKVAIQAAYDRGLAEVRA